MSQPDGGERLYLHMGYFSTLSEAQQWSQRVRARYPNAVATPAPLAHVQQPNSDAPALPIEARGATPSVQDSPPVRDDHLSDSQVMRILERRDAAAVETDTDERDHTRVELLQPDDTETRRTLKEAVVDGVPVPFAVQLEWSLQPIDAGRVPRLDLFKGYTLYRTEKRRAGRSCYFLRLGFFTDAFSAKEIACRVRSAFTSAAVVPVTEQEFLHADEARIDAAAPAGPYHEGIDEVPNAPNHQSAAPEGFQTPWKSTPKKRTSPETLEETLKVLAQREMWRQPDPLEDTGVRHLRVTLEDSPAKSTRKQKPPIRLA